MDNQFEYRENEFFNGTDTYLFQHHDHEPFESKVHYEKGYWWTNESLQFKATTIKCKRILKRFG